MDAVRFQPEISSFRLHLAAEGKAPKTIQAYTDALACTPTTPPTDG